MTPDVGAVFDVDGDKKRFVRRFFEMAGGQQSATRDDEAGKAAICLVLPNDPVLRVGPARGPAGCQLFRFPSAGRQRLVQRKMAKAAAFVTGIMDERRAIRQSVFQ